MKKLLFLSAILIIFFLPVSCKKFFNNEKNLPDLTKEEISGVRLWERFTKEDNYKKYPFWPDHEGLQPGKSPHGRYHKIFINPKLNNSLPINEKITPIGSIIIKENYDVDKKLDNYTVMVKVNDYNKKINDWFWVEYDKNGKILVEGKVDMCINCHAGKKDNDYLMVYKLDKPLNK